MTLTDVFLILLAAALAARATGRRRNEIYRLAMRLKAGADE